MRRRIFEILTNPRPDDRFARLVSLGLLVLIAANVTASVLETDAQLALHVPQFFEWFERVSVGIFTIEYALRLWSCTADPRFRGAIRGRARMATTPMALVDLIAIAPSYVALILPGTVDLRFLRVLRLLRLFRLLRAARLADAFAALTRVMQGKRSELAVTFALVLVAMLVAAGAVYVAEHKEPDTQFTSIPHAMWWVLETITTIGYDDMIPITPAGKLIGVIVGFVGICAVALPVGIVSSGFIEEINFKKQTEVVATTAPACPHCGGHPLA